MIATFISHQWKSTWRSRSRGKNLALQLFVGFFMLYIVFAALGIGFFLKRIIEQFFPGLDIIGVFCGFILYYFALDTLIRLQFQNLPTLAIQPYLTQNIKKSQLVGFLNVRSVFSVLNAIPLLLFTPFTFIVIAPLYGKGSAIALVFAILCLTLLNNFLILYAKRKSVISSWWYVVFFILFAGLIVCDYYKIFSISNTSAALFTYLLKTPALSLAFLVLAVLSYVNNYFYLRNNLYFQDLESKVAEKKEGSQNTFLTRFGITGELMALELKLILRNKRPRTVLFASIVFLLYGFIFYQQSMFQKNQWGNVLFGAIILTGAFISNYGQFLFAWQSSHFDGLMSSHLNVKTYIKSKMALLNVFSTIALILSSFYGFIDWRILPIHVAAYFFNIGVHTLLVAYFATRSYKGLELKKSNAFNFQGVGASQWIYSLLIFSIPLVIYFLLKLMFNAWVGIGVLGGIGIIGVLLQNYWLEKIVIQFNKRKHLILEGFREK